MRQSTINILKPQKVAFVVRSQLLKTWIVLSSGNVSTYIGYVQPSTMDNNVVHHL